MERRENYHHGLIKRGTTCYLNSVLQVLFMTREFRNALSRSVEKNPNSDFIDTHLKELFDRLQQKPTDTCKILNTLHINKVFEQQDAAEYLEKILKQTSPDTRKIFHGQMAHRTTCSDCGKETDTDGHFWYLPLELLNKNYSVETGIEEFFKTELSGENQMYCETCDIKVNSTSKYVIKHHPDVLILLLKKFDFSSRYKSYVKISCEVDVLYTLKIPQNQTYELYAVVDHFGNLRGGHYTATIKDDEDRWFSFDEDRVTPLSYNPFPDNQNVAKSSGAYLLFYRKKDSGLEHSVDEHTKEDHSSTRDADRQPADKARSTNVKAKRKEQAKGVFQERLDGATTGENRQKKLKPDWRPKGGNRSEGKTSQKEQKKTNNPDQSESDNPCSQRRKPLNTEPDRVKGLVDQELRNTEQNVSGTQKTQKDKLKRRSKNHQTDEDPDVSASERRERLRGNQAAERAEETKETAQTNTNRGLQEAADRGHSSDKSKVKVKKITETKKLVHSDKTNSRSLYIKTVEEESFIIEGNGEYNDRSINNKSDTNTTKVSLSSGADVDQSGSLQSDVSRLKDYQGLKLDVPDHKRSLKKKNLREILNTVQFKM